MKNAIENYWLLRLQKVQQALEANNFEVMLAADTAEAQKIVSDNILANLKPKSVAFGGSKTFTACGIYDMLLSREDIHLLDTAKKKGISAEQFLELRRQGLLADLYFCGTNAVTEMGQLVNLDMVGNRVGALTFGPTNVVVLVGRNKIVTDLDDAMYRIKNYAAPVNAMRLDMKTPCTKTSFCEECKSPNRICNTWTITEKSFPKGRVKVVLINQDLGF